MVFKLDPKLLVIFGDASTMLELFKLKRDILLVSGEESYFFEPAPANEPLKALMNSFAQKLAPYSKRVRGNEGDQFFGACREILEEMNQLKKLYNKKAIRLDAYCLSESGKIRLTDQINAEEDLTERIISEYKMNPNLEALEELASNLPEDFQIFQVWQRCDFSGLSVVVSFQ